MKRIDDLKNSLNYIEENLHGDVDIEIAAKKACLSKFYYYRLFNIVTGMTLAEYIRNRKMTLAAKDIKESGKRILDIALDFGYGSQEAFSRAFKSVHGISPVKARDAGIKIKAYPPITFQLQLKGDIEMDYKIEEKKALDIIGTSRKVSTKNGENFKIIPAFWQEKMQDGSFEKLCSLAKKDKLGSFGICMNYEEEKSEFEYVIGMYKGKECGEFDSFTIPETTYAIFGPVSMPELQSLWKRIFTEWLPATDYELTDGAQVEYYPPCDSDEDLKCEVWIPIKQ